MRQGGRRDASLPLRRVILTMLCQKKKQKLLCLGAGRPPRRAKRCLANGNLCQCRRPEIRKTAVSKAALCTAIHCRARQRPKPGISKRGRSTKRAFSCVQHCAKLPRKTSRNHIPLHHLLISAASSTFTCSPSVQPLHHRPLAQNQTRHFSKTAARDPPTLFSFVPAILYCAKPPPKAKSLCTTPLSQPSDTTATQTFSKTTAHGP